MNDWFDMIPSAPDVTGWWNDQATSVSSTWDRVSGTVSGALDGITSYDPTSPLDVLTSAGNGFGALLERGQGLVAGLGAGWFDTVKANVGAVAGVLPATGAAIAGAVTGIGGAYLIGGVAVIGGLTLLARTKPGKLVWKAVF